MYFHLPKPPQFRDLLDMLPLSHLRPRLKLCLQLISSALLDFVILGLLPLGRLVVLGELGFETLDLISVCVCMYVCTYPCSKFSFETLNPKNIYVCMYVCVCVCVCMYVCMCMCV